MKNNSYKSAKLASPVSLSMESKREFRKHLKQRFIASNRAVDAGLEVERH